MRYLKLFENFEHGISSIPDNFIRLNSMGHVLDPETGLMYAVWKNGGYDSENPYEICDNGIEDISDEEKKIVDKYWISCENFIKNKINWELIQMAKDLSLDYLDEQNELIIRVMSSETKTYNKEGHRSGRDITFDVYKEVFSHEENSIIWNKYFPNKMNIVKNGFLTYEFTIQPQRESKNWGIKAWEPEMTRELSSKLIEMFPDETIVNR